MCGPMAAMGVMMAMTALTSAQQARQQAKVQSFNKKVAAENEERAELQADDAHLRSALDQREIANQAKIDEQDFKVESAKERGSMLSALAANGSLISDNTSAGEALVQAKQNTELNANRIQSNAQRSAFARKQQGEQEAYGYGVEAADHRTQGQLAGIKKRGALLGGALNVGTSLVGGASKMYKYKAAQ